MKNIAINLYCIFCILILISSNTIQKNTIKEVYYQQSNSQKQGSFAQNNKDKCQKDYVPNLISIDPRDNQSLDFKDIADVNLGSGIVSQRKIQKDRNCIDPYCSQWKNGVCIKCSQGYYFLNGICKQIDPNCKSFDYGSLKCTGCYPGYKLSNGCCIIPTQITVSDPYCSEWKNGVCVKCSQGYYFLNGVCKQIDPNCKSFDYGSLKCTGCYPGYKLSNGCCIIPTQTTTSDPYCSQWKNGVCVKCSYGYYFLNGVCKQIDPNCKTFDYKALQCAGCYPGYKLSNGCCVIPTQTTVSDPYCSQWKNGVCVKCSYGYYFLNGVCKQIDPNCKTFDYKALQCAGCYPGYKLSNGCCVIPTQTTVSDPYCSQWKNGVCVKCSYGYYFLNGVCKEIDPNCKQFDYKSLLCTSCYTGYQIYNGICTLATNYCPPSKPTPQPHIQWQTTTPDIDSHCKKYLNGNCIRCQQGYTLDCGKCICN